MFSLFCKDIKSSFDKDYNLKDTVNAYSKIVKFESCRENIHESGTHSIKYVAVLFILVTLYQGLQNAWKQYPVIFLFSCSQRDFNNRGYLPFTWKFRLENQLVRTILFGELRKIYGL